VRDLRGVREVQSQTIDRRWRRLQLTAEEGESDLRERIASVLHSANCHVRELRREAPSLEHLFISMIARAEHEAATEANQRHAARGRAA